MRENGLEETQHNASPEACTTQTQENQTLEGAISFTSLTKSIAWIDRFALWAPDKDIVSISYQSHGVTTTPCPPRFNDPGLFYRDPALAISISISRDRRNDGDDGAAPHLHKYSCHPRNIHRRLFISGGNDFVACPHQSLYHRSPSNDDDEAAPPRPHNLPRTPAPLVGARASFSHGAQSHSRQGQQRRGHLLYRERRDASCAQGTLLLHYQPNWHQDLSRYRLAGRRRTGQHHGS